MLIGAERKASDAFCDRMLAAAFKKIRHASIKLIALRVASACPGT